MEISRQELLKELLKEYHEECCNGDCKNCEGLVIHNGKKKCVDNVIAELM